MMLSWGRGVSSAQAWQIVLDRMQRANAGWLSCIEAEQLLDEYFARIENVVGAGANRKGQRILFGTKTTDFGIMDSQYLGGAAPQSGTLRTFD
jgi:hypothetical protein